MRATVYHGPRDMRIDQVPYPIIEAPTDVLARITHAGICGSDLWSYRGIDHREPGDRMGHEWIGMVEEVGAEVRTIKKGDRVISPFLISDGTCEFCREGLPSSCVHGERWGGPNDGGQGEAVRVPYADGTLVVVPPAVEGDEHLLKAILPLTDVMATGHHAAITAGVRAGSTVVVIGDGAVGLCGVLAAKRLGAERIFLIGHREQRLKLAQAFGATDLMMTRDEQAVQEVLEQTHGGAEAVLECVGTLDAINMAIHMTRPGRSVSLVGFIHASQAPDLTHRLFQNITITGGVAPARAYLPELLQDVIAGKLDPSPVLDMTVNLDEVPAGYAAMDTREAIKVMVHP
ncbi:MAG TPA: alcohol dehydrogenase catalytic domain-containing protein [Ktedonobacteraceae bacterium]|nr:alcohol dehydrogenase catalytic domain-containing protein [Ktedonobacteraceae bacterium]